MALSLRSLIPHVVAIAALIALSAATLLLSPQTVSAHANQSDSSPQPSEELETAPDRVIVWFTEPIEANFSSIAVLNADGTDVTDGDTQFDASEPTAMWVPLAPLENGTYTVVWQNISSVDGHKVRGSFLFAVGEPLGATAPPDFQDQPLLTSPADPIVRWLIYISIAIFAGGLFFELAITNRLARSDESPEMLKFAQLISARFVGLAMVAIVILIVAQLMQIFTQASIIFDVSWFGVRASQLIDIVVQTEWGRFWSWRLTIAILAALSLLIAYRTRQIAAMDATEEEIEDLPLTTESPFGIAAVALGGLYLLLIALTSHNAATPSDIRWIAIATDIIHIIIAVIWVGGIAYLTLAAISAIRSDADASRNALLKLATGFGPIAIFVSTVLVASGIVSSLMQVTIPDALATPYGAVLGTKVLLLALLIGLAVCNNRRVARSSLSDGQDTRKLTRSIGAELAVAFAVLLATAGLASLEPARQYAERHGIGVEDFITHHATIDGVDIDVKLDPGSTGVNTLTVDAIDSDGEPFRNADEVRARIKYLDDEFGEIFVPLTNTADGSWMLENVTIGIGGAYQLDVTVVRSDAFDSQLSFRFDSRSSGFGSDAIRPSAETAMLALGILIAVAGAALFVVQQFGRRIRDIKPGTVQWLGVLILCIGLGVLANVYTLGFGLAQQGPANPFPLTQESVEIGRQVYADTCATCHGDTGRGDGPTGVALNPRPADLAIHVPLHTDNELYGFIADGIEGTVMVPQLGTLTSDEIWHLVNYIRTISE